MSRHQRTAFAVVATKLRERAAMARELARVDDELAQAFEDASADAPAASSDVYTTRSPPVGMGAAQFNRRAAAIEAAGDARAWKVGRIWHVLREALISDGRARNDVRTNARAHRPLAAVRTTPTRAPTADGDAKPTQDGLDRALARRARPVRGVV